MEIVARERKLGGVAAVSSAVVWGVLPIYWQALRPIDSLVIIFYRIVLVGLVCFILAMFIHGFKSMIEPIKNKKNMLIFFVAGLIVTVNWSIYIWAVNANFVIQTCIGYYIEPLMVCIFGVVIFKEKMNKNRIAALILAVVGLIVLLVHFKEIPSIALAIAITFAIYAAIKKRLVISPILSLLYETMFLVPPALGVIIYMEVNGRGALQVASPSQYMLLLLCGVMTAIPLGLFGLAANRINLVSLGIIGYISPSLSLLIGILLFREAFDVVQLAAFGVIWIGLIVFTLGEMKRGRLEELMGGVK